MKLSISVSYVIRAILDKAHKFLPEDVSCDRITNLIQKEYQLRTSIHVKLFTLHYTSIKITFKFMFFCID